MRKKTKEKNGFCSGCGAELGTATNGITVVAAFIGKDPGGCNECFQVAQNVTPKQYKTAQERIEALRGAGVDVSHLFAMQGANGGEFIASNKDGNLAVLNDNDPIFSYITNQGTVPNRHLFRRFVTAQMFHMMSHIPYGQRQPLGVTKMIHRLGYEYQWKMLINELNAQMKMEGRDFQNFIDRNRWFNAGVVAAMAEDYTGQLRKHINSLPVKHCKGVPYKRICGNDIFVSDLHRKLFYPLQMAIKSIKQTKNAAQLHYAAKQFNDMRLKMPSDTPQSTVWIDAYKGSGAYFTMQNLIRFHNCVVLDDAENSLDKPLSLAFISVKAEMYKNGEGWRLLAVLKKMLDDNNINIWKKMQEWRKKK